MVMRMHYELNSVNYQCEAMPASWLCVVKTGSCNPSVQNNFNEQFFACFFLFIVEEDKSMHMLLLHTYMHAQCWQQLMMHLK